MAICPVCSTQNFSSLDTIDFGVWNVVGQDLVRDTDILTIGRCVSCGHVMIISDYTAETFSRIYHTTPQDPVFWGEALVGSASPYQDMIAFCGASAITPDTLVVDVGCGPGSILHILNGTFGVPHDRLVGIDFNRRLPAAYRFIEANLNASDFSLPQDIDIAFASHVLEHLLDPRALLRRIHAALRSSGLLYIEVPDTLGFSPETCGPVNLINQQHIHYFTEASLVRLVTGCGFDVRRVERVTTGSLPRLKMLVKPRVEAAEAAMAVKTALMGLKTRRRLLAEEITARAGDGEAIGVWGIGADFSRMLEECPEFANAVAAGRITLFDLAHAGQRCRGAGIRPPADIVEFQGVVFLAPALGDVRLKMRGFAQRVGLPPGQVIDRHLEWASQAGGTQNGIGGHRPRSDSQNA